MTRKTLLRSSALSLALVMSVIPAKSFAQETTPQMASGTNRPLQLPEDSPFRDRDLFYLEADSLNNDERSGILTVIGDVEGRYEDRSLRADRVTYNRNTGQVIAIGNVTLIDATGSVQYAEKLELSEELDTGTATNYTGRLEGGGVVGARFVNRTTDEEFEFYNAYYTACEICREDGEVDKPSWRLKAKRVRQDKGTRTIRYNDATLELFGLPVFYTPYLAHPDPSANRASGLLTPFVGLTSDKGATLRAPYYWAIDDYTEATITPRIYSKVNPLLGIQFSRRFNTGRVDIDTSFTYGSIFDREGNAFDDPNRFTVPSNAPIGKRLRSHIYLDGYFQPSDFWTYGYGVQIVSDDNYLDRYDLRAGARTRGIYESESRRNTSQAFLVGQDEKSRFSISTVGFQNLRSRFVELNDGRISFREDNNAVIPIIAPKIEAVHYINDPVINGRFKLYGDTTWITREDGTDYGRATAGLDYSKTWIAPLGLEVQPFANVRFDIFNLEAQDQDEFNFTRSLGQLGVDIRYPFIKTVENVNFIIEPRALITQSFGDGKLDRFQAFDDRGFSINLQQDGTDIDLDQALFWQSNKASGYDFWQEGLRADIGASFIADWNDNRAHLFVGQSYSRNIDETSFTDLQGNPIINAENLDQNTILPIGSFNNSSGLAGDTSDLIGLFEFNAGRRIVWKTRLRFDDEASEFRRIDSSLRYRGKRFSLSSRYYRLQGPNNDPVLSIPTAPREELSGRVGIKITDNWSTNYRGFYDIDANNLRRQRFGLTYKDDCTLVELFYNKINLNNDAVRDTSGFGIRVALLTLGDTGR